MGVTKEEVHQGNVRRKVLVSGNWSQQTTKNEPVVGRNFVHRARPCKGAKLTPWLWAGGTKEVRTRRETEGDPGRYGRCAAIEGRVIQRPCIAGWMTFCFVYPKISILVPDTLRCPSFRFIRQRYNIEKSFILKEKSLDFIGR